MRKNRSIIIPYVFTLGCIALSAKLFAEGRSYPGTGWAIIAGIFTFILFVERFLRGREDRIERAEHSCRDFIRQQNERSLEDPESYTEILTSRNCVEVQAVLDSLKQDEIDCVVFDSHSAALLRFLPEVEMRVMVCGKDYKRSVEIITEVIGKDLTPNDA